MPPEADPTTPTPTPITPAPAPARRESELVAELAAERVSKADIQRTLEARATRAESDLAAANLAAEGKVTTEVGKVTEKLTKLQLRLVDAELKAGAAAAGLRDQDLLLHPLLDRTKVMLSEDGTVTGIEAAFADLKTKKPEWFGTGPATPTSARPPTGGPAPAPGTTTPPVTNVREFKTPAEYNAFKQDLRRQLRKG